MRMIRIIRINNKKGFSILETLVAIAIFTMAVLGPLTLTTYSIRSVSFARNQTVAFYLAQEAVEYVRNVRDSNSLNPLNPGWLWRLTPCQGINGCYLDVFVSSPNDFNTCPGGNCPVIKYDSSNGRYNYSSGSDTLFVRRIQIEDNYQGRSYEALVTVELSWEERFLSKTFIIQEHMFDWK